MTCSVQKVGDGRYRVRVYIDGKIKSRSFPAANMREARTLSAQHEAAIRSNVAETVTRRGTVAELVDQWLEYQRGEDRSPATLYRLGSITRVINEQLGQGQRRELTAHQINQFYAALRRTQTAAATGTRPARYMTESTIHHYHRVLRSILNYGEQHDMVDVVATRKASKPKPISHEIVLPDDATMERLFSAAPDSIKMIVRVDALLGLRRGELVGLQWADLQGGVVNVRHNTIEVPGVGTVDKTPKSRRPRRVPMVGELQRELAVLRSDMERHAESCGTVLATDARVLADVLTDPTGRTPISPSWISGTWRRHCTKFGVHVRWHDLRHWFVTNGLAAGIPMRDMMEYAGHAQITTTQRYAHLEESAHESARRAIGTKAGLLALPAPVVPGA